jgi:lipoyl(octanoyl) transferase
MVEIIDKGLIEYSEARAFQIELYEQSQQKKINGLKPDNYFVLCEHYPVYTIGKSGSDQNILFDESYLGAPVYRIERGGDVTFHGPGQIVGYPIIDLEQFGIGLRQYIENLEETIIRVIARYGLKGERINTASGVWLDKGTSRVRKICAIGVKAGRHITMHGFAFNVNTDLTWFQKINPCGFTDKGVTSLAVELGAPQDYDSIKNEVTEMFFKVMGLKTLSQ